MLFADSDIEVYYRNLWTIADKTSAITIDKLEELIPFELEIYFGLLMEKIKKEAEQ